MSQWGQLALTLFLLQDFEINQFGQEVIGFNKVIIIRECLNFVATIETSPGKQCKVSTGHAGTLEGGETNLGIFVGLAATPGGRQGGDELVFPLVFSYKERHVELFQQFKIWVHSFYKGFF
ncbi:hypothetical protein BH10CYA1_BH10CYA1_00230 [soil metagenome]